MMMEISPKTKYRTGGDKSMRKLAKKNWKTMNVISKQIGIDINPTPTPSSTQWVVVWGLGLEGGYSKQFIKTYFTPEPLEVLIIPDKSYCFLRYGSVEDALLLKQFDGKDFNGKQSKQTLYIGFLSEAPLEENLDPIRSFTTPWPPGLQIIKNFVSESEEQFIISNISLSALKESGTSLKKRWVYHFGYEFRYGTNDVDKFSPLQEEIPLYLKQHLGKMTSDKIFTDLPEQLTVNQYRPGQGIPPHVDTHSCFEGPIVSLSLGSDIVMDFRRGTTHLSVVVPARSLLVMDGESRLGWTHCIPSRKFDIIPDTLNGGMTSLNRNTRTSLTFRKLRPIPLCTCSFAEMCDSQKAKITCDNAADLEDKLVHKVYERIAPHFDETRHKPWPRVKEFIESIEPGGILLDVGCGNGKYLGLNNNIIQIGSDMSTGLLEICKEKNLEVLRANALKLPFQDESFRALICIAVLHHIATTERRSLALEEMLRVLQPNGEALVYVWAKDQHIEEVESTWATKQGVKTGGKVQPLLEEYSFLPVHDRELDFPRNDMLVPWINTKDTERPVHHRYYHVFDKAELDKLVVDLGTTEITDSYYDQGNWVVRFRKCLQ